MGRARRQNLDLAAVLKGPEGVDDVAVEAAEEILEEPAVPRFPGAGQGPEGGVAGPVEAGPVLAGDLSRSNLGTGPKMLLTTQSSCQTEPGKNIRVYA